MQISVIICTWNRCELLRRTLDSLRSSIVPDGLEWELVLVDNGCTDATDEVVAEYRELLPLRTVLEPEVGVSRARNAGARAASGDLILFTDDDVRVEPDWLRVYTDAAKQWPHAGFFAGRIVPELAAGVPQWVRRNQRALAGMLCLRDGEPTSRELRRGEFPFGPNMAIRREVLAGGSFDERLGRRGEEHLRGSEISLFRTLERNGVTGVWVPMAMVHHYVPPCRANVRYLWNYYRGEGRTQVRLTVLCRLRSRRELLMTATKTLGGTFRRPLSWPRHLATVASLSGQLSELRRLSVGPSTDQTSEALP